MNTIEAQLDTQLGIMSEAMRETLERSRVAQSDDEFGHRRSGEIANLTRLAKSSARIVAALARLSGEFRHNITVDRRGGPVSARKPPEATEPAPEAPHADARDGAADRDRPAMALLPPPPSNFEGSNDQESD